MRKTTISNLPEDVLLEIFFRVPLTSLKPMRLTCKKWNALSKTQIIGKARKQLIGLMHSRVCSMKLDLEGIRNDSNGLVDPSIKRVSVTQVFHCNGLLLCVTKNRSKLLVWNPYLGLTTWIEPRIYFTHAQMFSDPKDWNNGAVFVLGYDKNNHNHKILRISYNPIKPPEIYDFSVNRWRFLHVKPDWDIDLDRNYVSLKGNTYFFAGKKKNFWQKPKEVEEFLLCFDFTTERLGPRLPLPPVHASFLFCVRDEQLAVLHQVHDMKSWNVIDVEIWVTNKIEPNALSWSKFWKMDVKQFAGFTYNFEVGSFFIDEEQKAAMVFSSERFKVLIDTCLSQKAYVHGTNGYFKSVNIKKTWNQLEISSYVPSLVQL